MSPSTLTSCGATPPRCCNAGFTIIELMVSMAVGLLLIAALTMVLSSSSQNSRSNDRTSELMNNGRYALATVQRDLLHAGLRGFTYAEPNPPSGITGITNECATGLVSNLRQGIWGANDSNPFSSTCIPAANYARGDVLVVRRTGLDAATTLTSTNIYFSSSYEAGEMFKGATVPASMTYTPRTQYPMQAFVYYISPWTTSASESPKIPALYRVGLGSGPAMAAELVASGIEHLQVQYSRATTDLKTRYYNADAVSATATSTSTAITEWDDVNSARVWLLARNSTAEPGFSNTTSYVMGDVTYTVNDGFRRQLFTTVVQLRK